MGSERASTTRQRLAGKVCTLCRTPLPPGPPGERRCHACTPQRRVYMGFMLVQVGWHVTFLEADLKTPLARAFNFQDELKIIDLARRGGADFTSADRQALEQAIQMGRGGVWLRLSPSQYQMLTSSQQLGPRRQAD